MNAARNVTLVDHGRCAVLSCHSPADVEWQERVAPDRWLVSRACFWHAPDAVCAEVEAEMFATEPNAVER